MECVSLSTSQIPRNRGGRGGAVTTEFQEPFIPTSVLSPGERSQTGEKGGEMLISRRGCSFLSFFFPNSVRLLQAMKTVHFLETNSTVYFNYSNIFRVPLPVKGSVSSTKKIQLFLSSSRHPSHECQYLGI